MIKKQQILVAIVTISAIFLIFTLHFHNKGTESVSDLGLVHKKGKSSVSLRGIDNVDKSIRDTTFSTIYEDRHNSKPETGEFGSSVPFLTETDQIDHPSNDILNATSNFQDTHESDKQFALENLRHDPTLHVPEEFPSVNDTHITASTVNTTTVVQIEAYASLNNATLAPTFSPTYTPTSTIPPTLTPTESMQQTAAPTVQPFQAQTFSGNIGSDISWKYVADMYRKDFTEFADSDSTDNFGLSTTELVHKALKNGYITPKSKSLSNTDSNFRDAIVDIIDSVHPGIVQVYSFSAYSIGITASVAKQRNDVPILLHTFNSPYQAEKLPYSNVVTVRHRSFSTKRALLRQPLDCVQVVEDFSIFVKEQLPFEFEELVHDFLCQCNMTFVPKSLPSTPYFVVWDSVESLIANAAVAKENSKCGLNLLPTGALSDKFASLTRYTHLIVQRNLTTSLGGESSWFSSLREPSSAYLTLTDLATMPVDISSGINLAASLSQRFAAQVISSTNDTSGLFWTGKTVKTSAEIASTSASNNRFVAINYTVPDPSPSPSNSRRLYTTYSGSSSSQYEDKDQVERDVPNVLWLSHETVGSDDTVLIDMMHQLQRLQQQANDKAAATERRNINSGIASRSNSKTNGRFSLTKTTRLAQAQLYRDENDNYRFWMQLIREGRLQQHSGKVMDDLLHVQRMNGSLIVMGHEIGLFSTKLAMLLQHEIPASRLLLTTILTQPSTADILYKLNAVMNVQHNLIATPSSFSASWFFAVSLSRISMDMMVLESDVMFHLLATLVEEQQHEVDEERLIQSFVQRTALFLALSKVAYWKLPSSAHLWTHILQFLSIQVDSSLGQKVLDLLIHPEILFQRIADQLSSRFLVSVDTVQTADALHVRVYRIEMVPVSGRSKTTALQSYVFPRGLSLHALSWLEVIPAQKKCALNLLLQLPLWILRNGDSASTATRGQSSDADVQSIINAMSVRDIYLRINPSTDDFEMVVQNIGHLSAEHTIGSRLSHDISPEITTAHGVWKALQTEFQQHPAELANGRFSFLEYHSGLGLISTRLAYEYPDATVFSLEKEDANTEYHIGLADAYNVSNDAICHLEMDATILHRNLYESPELFRFQLFFNNALKQFQETSDLDEWGKHMGATLSSALTSFVYVPNRALVSLGLYALYGVYCTESTVSIDLEPAEKASSSPTWQCRSVFRSGSSAGSSSRGVYIHAEDLLSVYAQGSSSSQPASSSSSTESETEISQVEEWYRLTKLAAHPQRYFVNFHSDWLLSTARAQSSNSESSVMFSPMSINAQPHATNGDTYTDADTDTSATSSFIYNGALDFPMMRCDIVNMTRHVHHHFDYARDGHSRTYTMHIGINHTETASVLQFLQEKQTWHASVPVDIAQMQTQVDQKGVHLSAVAGADSAQTVDLPLGHHPCQHHITSVKLYRDKDDWPIPYTSIYGVTLITALRMGLKSVLRDRLFSEFLRLPLYEDMAPWNIVLFGKTVDYIDYDTKDVTFDEVLPKAYQIMTVLMNYKRTVEDFKRCGSKASTVYGLPYVSDCVGSTALSNAPNCNNDLRYPVPCGDGHCHSDYISCLRSLARIAEQVSQQEHIAAAQAQPQPSLSLSSKARNSQLDHHLWAQDLALAMKAVVAKFNSTTYEKIAYEDFLAATRT